MTKVHTDTAAPVSAGKQKKIGTVASLTDKLSRAHSLVFADYRGLKTKQLEDLRRKLRKDNGELVIIKNRLFLRTFGNRAEKIEQFLKDTTAVLFGYGDEIAPLKTMKDFFKAQNMGKAKGGLIGTSVISETDVDRLSALPNKPVLLTTLVRQLNAPIQNLHYALSWNINRLVWALDAVKGKKV